jgi:multiple sugar transport system permease protein
MTETPVAPTGTKAPTATPPPRRQEGALSRPRGRVATVAMAVLALVWLFPLLWAVLNSFREYTYTQANGYLSFGGWTFDNYREAWTSGNLAQHFTNSLIITVPAVVLTLFLSSMVAFVLARFSFRFNLTLLAVFLAANLLPPQALLVPVFRIYREIPLPTFMSDTGQVLGSYWGLIAINMAFQMGFCTFVLSNYMKTLPFGIYESAQIDGASVWRQYWQITMPLVRPALAALATLQVTWIYNEFFWATVLLGGRGEKFPVTSALNNLQGQYFTDTNLLAAGSVLIAMPVVVVFLVLQKQFVSGLTLGAAKG